MTVLCPLGFCSNGHKAKRGTFEFEFFFFNRNWIIIILGKKAKFAYSVSFVIADLAAINKR